MNSEPRPARIFGIVALLITGHINRTGSFSQEHEAVLHLARPTLVGRTVLPADSFVSGPTSGQFISPANGRTPPFINSQPLQGFSAILRQDDGSYLVMSDNGYGAKDNSADFLLRVHRVVPNFQTAEGGTGQVAVGTIFVLSDPDHRVNFPIVADMQFYPNGAGNVQVPPAIKASRLLTGADFDIESMRQVKDGTFWFGDEFGPFLIHTDASGRVLDTPTPLPDVRSPQNPFLQPGETPNLAPSHGFEGMALSADGKTLYPMLEGPLTTDADRRRLIINEFDLNTRSFTSLRWYYEMDDTTESGQSIGDMSAVNDHQFLVIERDNNQGATATFKKIFLVDFHEIDARGNLVKHEVVNLLNLADPNNLGGAGNFTFPYQTIEGVQVLDPWTIVVSNDNNYPFSSGRTTGQPDSNEIILIRLSEPLKVTLNSLQEVKRGRLAWSARTTTQKRSTPGPSLQLAKHHVGTSPATGARPVVELPSFRNSTRR